MRSKQNCPASRLGNSKQTTPYNNSSACQRARILKHFKSCPRLSTIEARQILGIMHPGGRIMELRREGFRIDRYWKLEPDSNRVNHRVALYVYKGKPKPKPKSKTVRGSGGSRGKN